MNSPLNIDVDYIVQEVVRRLTDARVGEVKIVDGAERPDSAETVDKGQLALSERVITLEVLRGRLNGVRAVIVPDRAIVTPAVVDELKSQKIELRRAGGQNKACIAESVHGQSRTPWRAADGNAPRSEYPRVACKSLNAAGLR